MGVSPTACPFLTPGRRMWWGRWAGPQGHPRKALAWSGQAQAHLTPAMGKLRHGGHKDWLSVLGVRKDVGRTLNMATGHRAIWVCPLDASSTPWLCLCWQPGASLQLGAPKNTFRPFPEQQVEDTGGALTPLATFIPPKSFRNPTRRYNHCGSFP